MGPCSLTHKHRIQHVCAMHACIAGLHARCQGYAIQLQQEGRRHACICEHSCITTLDARLTRKARLRTRMQCISSSSSSRQAACIPPAASMACGSFAGGCGSFAGGSSLLMPTVSSRPIVPTLNFAARRATCPESSDVQDSLSSSSMRSGILGESTL